MKQSLVVFLIAILFSQQPSCKSRWKTLLIDSTDQEKAKILTKIEYDNFTEIWVDEGGNRTMIFEGEKGLFFPDVKKIHIQRLNLLKYRYMIDEIQKTQIKADFATFLMETSVVEATQNVLIIQEGTYRMIGDSINWDLKTDELRSPKDSIITLIKSDGSVIRGTEFKANVKTGKYELNEATSSVLESLVDKNVVN